MHFSYNNQNVWAHAMHTTVYNTISPSTNQQRSCLAASTVVLQLEWFVIRGQQGALTISLVWSMVLFTTFSAIACNWVSRKRITNWMMFRVLSHNGRLHEWWLSCDLATCKVHELLHKCTQTHCDSYNDFMLTQKNWFSSTEAVKRCIKAVSLSLSKDWINFCELIQCEK